mmetsp:Transcript_2369/g.7555  ORF Transcript_2369/g.7555 Transcript_2369/m.7555 type:complete len:577 (+) Transcript_2369:222-1952(+)
MEGCRIRVAAICVQANTVADHAEVAHGGDAQALEAIAHPEVLPPRLPRQRPASGLAVEVGMEGLRGDGLNRSKHHRSVGHASLAAGQDEGGVAGVDLQLLPQPGGDDHGVGVGLDGPVCGLVTPVPLHGFPDVHEERRVSRSAVLAAADGRRLEVDSLQRTERTVPQACPPVGAEGGVVVAGEDADALGELVAHEVRLLVVEPEDGEAEERGGAPSPWCASAQLFATPRLVGLLVHQLAVDLHLLPLSATRQTTSPLVVVPVTLHALLLAAPRVEAVLRPRLAAVLLHPLARASDRDRSFARRPAPERRAVPGVVVVVVHVDTGVATDQALGRVLVLLEALHAGADATPQFRTVLAVASARLGNPFGRRRGPRWYAGRPHAQLLAVPRIAIRIGRVWPWNAASLAARPGSVLPVASGAGLRATPRFIAVRTGLHTLLRDPRCCPHDIQRRLEVTWRPLSERLASPGRVVYIRWVRAGVAGRPAEGPHSVRLHVALCAGDLAAPRRVAVLVRRGALHLLCEDLLQVLVGLCGGRWMSEACKHEQPDRQEPGRQEPGDQQQLMGQPSGDGVLSHRDLV